MKGSPVPSFFLYGEPPRAVTARFIHLEALDDRSRPNEWIIRPHAHFNLNHVFFITEGAGTAYVDAQSIDFVGPTLLVVPATTVHGFRFDPNTRGYVLTIADSFLDDLCRSDPDLMAVKTFALTSPGEAASLEADLKRLQTELGWRALGHTAAVEGRLLTLLVDVIRAAQLTRAAGATPAGPQAILLARFRELIDARFRDGWSVERYAVALNANVARLRKACRYAATSPLRLVHERVALEAKRMLLYSDLTIAEIAFALGFEDAAYFSRLFSRWAGVSPLAYRCRGTDVNG